MKNKNGVVLYEGPSVLDGEPIVVIATFNSKNEKTGDMVQTWIMRSDMSPVEAGKNKQDVSVCGKCPHRRNLGGACYVTLHQAPSAVYRSYKKGNYPKGNARDFEGLDVRLGSYGDPAAVPYSTWRKFLKHARSNTGYTHQHRHPEFDKRIANLCMVSVDTPKQAIQSQKQGYKTFRIKSKGNSNLEGEVSCVNETVGISCKDCGLCDGKVVNVTVTVHGTLTKRFDGKFGRII